jgi:hypothetical protein
MELRKVRRQRQTHGRNELRAPRQIAPPLIGDRHQGDDAAVQEIDMFDFLAGQMQERALADEDDLQMRLEQHIILGPQRGQETIASMLLVGIHVGPIFSRTILDGATIAFYGFTRKPSVRNRCPNGSGLRAVVSMRIM